MRLLRRAFISICLGGGAVSILLRGFAALVLFWVEVFVCLVQAVVFSMLVQRYFMEVWPES